MPENEPKTLRDTPEWPLPLTVLLLVLVLWLACGYLAYQLGGTASVGDMFGAVNALFSGLALGGVVYAIVLQRNELRLQRLELTLTRRELKEQKEVLSAQNTTLREQNFEHTFFQLLRVLNETIGSIEIQTNPTPTRGRDSFQIFYNERLRYHWRKAPEKAGLDALERINQGYLAFYTQHEGQLGHYFRTLYNLVKFVDRSAASDKRLYTNLIRAQLSSFELLLLFYNALSKMGREKFKPLIEQYGLLKMLSKDLLFDHVDHVKYYEPSAYGTAAPEPRE